MAKNIKNEQTDFLFRAILKLDSVEECYDFFDDLCTIAEIQEMSGRMKAAKMLYNNHIYTEIAEKTGLSTATISRVNKCLKYGNDGYVRVLDRLADEEKRRK